MNMIKVAMIVGGSVCMIAAARKARAARENEINKYIAEVNASLDKFVAELKDLPA